MNAVLIQSSVSEMIRLGLEQNPDCSAIEAMLVGANCRSEKGMEEISAHLCMGEEILSVIHCPCCANKRTVYEVICHLTAKHWTPHTIAEWLSGNGN
jgi:hypothetical protein